jgi:signal transduction histidine kinase
LHELRTPLTNFKTRLYLLGKQLEKMEQHLSILICRGQHDRTDRKLQDYRA